MEKWTSLSGWWWPPWFVAYLSPGWCAAKRGSWWVKLVWGAVEPARKIRMQISEMGIGLGQIQTAIPALKILSDKLMFYGGGWNGGGARERWLRAEELPVVGAGRFSGQWQTLGNSFALLDYSIKEGGMVAEGGGACRRWLRAEELSVAGAGRFSRQWWKQGNSFALLDYSIS